uniref:Uncharacterized protein n=1 Tax=Romanomermis culicivorax TaxID=13658 RepID=A0A915JVW9_ROMCU
MILRRKVFGIKVLNKLKQTLKQDAENEKKKYKEIWFRMLSKSFELCPLQSYGLVQSKEEWVGYSVVDNITINRVYSIQILTMTLFSQAIVNEFEPIISSLSEQLELTRSSQQNLRQQIDSLTTSEAY